MAVLQFSKCYMPRPWIWRMSLYEKQLLMVETETDENTVTNGGNRSEWQHHLSLGAFLRLRRSIWAVGSSQCSTVWALSLSSQYTGMAAHGPTWAWWAQVRIVKSGSSQGRSFSSTWTQESFDKTTHRPQSLPHNKLNALPIGAGDAFLLPGIVQCG